MSEPPRDQGNRTPPHVDFDDASIPVLHERLQLHALEIDMGLPRDDLPDTDAASAEAEPGAAPDTRAAAGGAPQSADAPMQPEPIRSDMAGEAAPDVEPIDSGSTPAAAAAQSAVLTAAQLEELRGSLLARMQTKVSDQISESLRDLMQPAIDDTIVRLADEAKFALQLIMQELVERALRDEQRSRSEGGADAPPDQR